jgi:hypothetical protein
MDVTGSGPAPTEAFGPAAARMEESSTEIASGYQEPTADTAEGTGEEGEARLSPNDSEVPRQSFAEQLEQRGEA